MIISQPSSTLPLGAAAVSMIVKCSKSQPQKIEALSTICCFLRDHGHCGEQWLGEATLQAPKGRDPRPHWKLLDFRRQRFMSHDQKLMDKEVGKPRSGVVEFYEENGVYNFEVEMQVENLMLRLSRTMGTGAKARLIRGATLEHS